MIYRVFIILMLLLSFLTFISATVGWGKLKQIKNMTMYSRYLRLLMIGISVNQFSIFFNLALQETGLQRDALLLIVVRILGQIIHCVTVIFWGMYLIEMLGKEKEP